MATITEVAPATNGTGMYLDSETTRQRLDALPLMERRLTFRISRLSKLLDIHATRVLSGSGLNLTGYRLLMVLGTFKETIAADLSRLMVIDRAQISRALTEMIRTGYIAERADPTSQRKTLLCLTDAGKAKVEPLRDAFESREQALFALLGADQRNALLTAIDTLSRHLAQDLNQPEAAPSGNSAV